MQAIMLLYHYFNAKNVYNFVRVLVASYFWMTGYGHVSSYLESGDFSISRQLRTQWRLCFLIFVCCAVLDNEPMLYYQVVVTNVFQMMLWLAVRAASAATDGDTNSRAQRIRILRRAVSALCTGSAMLWLLPTLSGVFDEIFGRALPLGWALRFRGSLHEFRFRSTLDLVPFLFGCVSAMIGRQAVRALGTLQGSRRSVVLAAVCIAGLTLWAHCIVDLDKYAYNARHPLTAALPISLYLVARNAAPGARRRYVGAFAALGRVSLEVYVAQFHVWMSTTGPDYSFSPNQSPKRILRLLPSALGGDWPQLNFVFASAVLLFLARRLATTTATIGRAVLPPRTETRKLLRNLLRLGTAWGAVLCAARAVSARM
jgi:hypothetical protein